MFVISFKNGNNDPKRDPFDNYYMPLVEIKVFTALIDNKPFFNQPVKNKPESYEKLVETSKNDHCTTGNLLHLENSLDFLYHQNYDKLIDIYLSIQPNIHTNIPQQINFTGKLIVTE